MIASEVRALGDLSWLCTPPGAAKGCSLFSGAEPFAPKLDLGLGPFGGNFCSSLWL